MWEAPQVPNPKPRGCFVAVRHLRCLPHSRGFRNPDGPGEPPARPYGALALIPHTGNKLVQVLRELIHVAVKLAPESTDTRLGCVGNDFGS